MSISVIDYAYVKLEFKFNRLLHLLLVLVNDLNLNLKFFFINN